MEKIAEAVYYLQTMFIGFAHEVYLQAVMVGNIDNFKNYDKYDSAYRSHLCHTYHDLFIARATVYLNKLKFSQP